MPEKGKVELRALTANIEEEQLVVRVRLFNPGQRSLHAYGIPRRVSYDNATGKLTLCLHDQHVQENRSSAYHLSSPTLVSLEGNTETEIEILLPKVMNRIRSAVERGSGPLTEQLRVSETKEIDLEVAYSDTPFDKNPNPDLARQLIEWGSNIVKANFKFKPRQGRE